MLQNLRELFQYRALLHALVVRELKARYRNSVLGFLWTFLNPTLLMLVYSLVFSVNRRGEFPHYTYFMFVGLLPWICFSTSVMGGTSSVSDRRDLLTKVRFPAQVLPATVVAVNAVNYLLSLPLLLVAAWLSDVPFGWPVLMFPVVLGVQLLFTLSVTYLLAAFNVGFRDLQYIVGNVMTLWFFLTPVLYRAADMPPGARELVQYANPMSVVVVAYQAIFYERSFPDFAALGGLLALSLGLLWVAAGVFERRREEFAETV
jgi:lipopolysaccharide transport system permease protein